MRMQLSVRAALLAGTMACLAAGAARADLLRYADAVAAYNPGDGAGDATPGGHPANFFIDPSRALGSPSTGHTAGTPQNADGAGDPTVVSLGQGGSITLGFDTAAPNQGASQGNPKGYDLLIWGNSFQGGAVITPEFEFGRFQESGFVEVAQADVNGDPIAWYLILPRIYHEPAHLDRGDVPRDFAPNDLAAPTLVMGMATVSGDLDRSASLFDGLVDCVPANGATLAAVQASNDVADLVLDDPATFDIEGVGGTGIDISRAVLQSSPGVPDMADLDDDGEPDYQFVDLDHIDLLRISDVYSDDVGETGNITTDVDGVIVLPSMSPEPGTLALLALPGVVFLLRQVGRTKDRAGRPDEGSGLRRDA